VPPMHALKFGPIGVILKIKMVFALEPNRSVGVVEPAFF